MRRRFFVCFKILKKNLKQKINKFIYPFKEDLYDPCELEL